MREKINEILQLTLEVLHDIQEKVVYFGQILKLNFDGVEIGESVRYVERAIDCLCFDVRDRRKT